MKPWLIPNGDTRLQRLTIALLWLIVASYAFFVVWSHIDGYRAAARGEIPLYTDYTPTYAASLLVHDIPAEYLYVPRTMAQACRFAAHAMYSDISDNQARGVGFAPFMYPPSFILVIAPLAYLPYLPSYLLWLAATAVPYLAALRTILRSQLAWPFALAAPPAFFNIMYGQTGFLTAGFIGLGLALLGKRPVWAGVLIGLASVKPHFGILIPLALIAGAHWRAFAAATATVFVTIAASVIAFGDDPWFAFIGSTLFHLDGFRAGAYNLQVMTTVWSALRMAGASMQSAWLAQTGAAMLVAGIVVWAWRRGRRRPDTHGLQAALLCLAALLAVPMAYLYDLTLTVPAAAWLWIDMRQRGARGWEPVLLAGAVAALLAVKEIAGIFGIQCGPLIVAVLFALALHRYRQALAGSP